MTSYAAPPRTVGRLKRPFGNLYYEVSGSGPALLFALDRRAAAPEIRDLLTSHDVLLLDRYVTSNAAYGSARLGGPAFWCPRRLPMTVIGREQVVTELRTAPERKARRRGPAQERLVTSSVGPLFS